MTLSPEDNSWVTATLAGLSPEEKIGQLLVPVLSDNTAHPRSVTAMVEKFGIGGGHLFAAGYDASRKIVKEVQAAANVPLLISGDLEAGAGAKIPACTRFGSQMALGATGDEDLAYRMGAAIATEGRAVGYNWVFGPVVDLSLDKGDLANIRCLGQDPATVSRLARSLVRGIQEHGMAACAKHFPGAALDDRDSHLMTPVNPFSREEWAVKSGLPFTETIAADVWSVMSSHIALPAYDNRGDDPNTAWPASLSRPLLTDLLRTAMGFTGVVVTDALTMGGVTAHLPHKQVMLKALQAGNDMLLFVRRLDTLLDYFKEWLDTGALTEADITAKARRVLELKTKLGLHMRSPVMPDAESRKALAGSPYKKDAETIAERSVTLLRDRKKTVPLQLRPGSRIASILITNQRSTVLDAFNGVLAAAGHTVEPMMNPGTDELYDRVDAGEFDLTITSFFYGPQYGWSTNRIHGPQSRCLMSGYFNARPDDVPAVFISFAHPYHLYEMPYMNPFLVTYGADEASQTACARVLLGQLPVRGTVPVALDGFFAVGDGVTTKDSGTPQTATECILCP